MSEGWVDVGLKPGRDCNMESLDSGVESAAEVGCACCTEHIVNKWKST